MNLFRRFSTLRHGRGFGVHSPLGYLLITSVLRDTPQYYGDANIRTLYNDRRQRRIARIILRLIAYFEPNTLYTAPHYASVVPLASKQVRMVAIEDNPDMAVVEDNGKVVLTIGQPTSGHGPLVLDNEKDLRIIIYRSGLSPTYINTKL